MVNHVFVYDELLHQHIRNVLKLTPISEKIGETQGKLYKMYRTHIMLLPHQLTRSKGCARLFGAILEFPKSEMESVLMVLDNFKSCSKGRTNAINPSDLTYRTIIPVSPISFDSIHDFKRYAYQRSEQIPCYTHLGNYKNETIKQGVHKNMHSRVSNGLYEKGFLELIKRQNII